MSPTQLLFHDDVRARIRKGVNVLAQAVAVTLGPRGPSVILERDFGSPQIVNSGALVTKSIERIKVGRHRNRAQGAQAAGRRRAARCTPPALRWKKASFRAAGSRCCARAGFCGN